METNEPVGSVADAENGQSSAQATANPGWGRTVIVVVIAAAFAAIFGGPVNVPTVVVVIAVLAATVGGVLAWQRYRGVRPHTSGRGLSRTYQLGLIGMCAGGPIVARVLEIFLTPGTATSYVVQFIAAATIYGVGMTVLARGAQSSEETRL